MHFILLTHDKLSVPQVQQAVESPQAGAVSLFVGTTRDNFNGKKVVALEYEAYHQMATKQMNLVCDRAVEKWPDVIRVAAAHRLGHVPIGDASVVIAVASPHRRTAIDACSFVIDELKATVPIWKKELYEDGSTWKANAEAFATLSRQPS